MSIINVPGHETDSIMGALPKVAKTSITATILNKSKIPLNIRGSIIQPGKQAAIRNWNVLQGDNVVRQWLQAKALEIIKEEEVTGEPESDE
jgi:hypothetical protein